MSVPSDKEIQKAAAEILKNCDVATTTLKNIRKQLEDKFQCSLSEKKDIIYESFDKFLSLNEDILKYNEVVTAENEAEGEGDTEPIEEPLGNKKKTKSKGGFSAEVHLSPDLADFMGQEKMPRTEVTKRIWAYIKEHDLQDPRDKRKILCDAALEKVLKRKSIHMFTMTKVLSALMKSPKEVGLEVGIDSEDAPPAKKSKKTSKRARKDDDEEDQDSEDEDSEDEVATKKSKKRKSSVASTSAAAKKPTKLTKSNNKEKKKSGFTISDALCNLLGLQNDETRYQVVAKIWEYIRAHSLQNPADKREVRLDAAMQEVFKVKTFTIFSMNKHISGQIYKNDD
mmetsp:Transcript_43365/g.86152  ORF Transcript_43365/g.86152 Transcript_43365/m.86152 type:complete len:340 (-) Transcript_43365:19-1038(-)